jgi:hypothetical protein
MLRAMKRAVLIVALVGCGGHVGAYEVTTDSGACTLYTPTSPGSDYCNVSPCDAGSGDAGPKDLGNTAIVKCGDSP